MDVNLISCNIRFDNPADGNNSWSHRRVFLSEVLRTHTPHIIATQEGRIDQLNDLGSLLGDYSIVDHHRSWIKERMYPTFFLKNGTFELLASGDSWLSETPGVAGSASFQSAFPRLMTWMKVQLKDSALKFLIINTHLDHIKAETRLGQIRVLVEETKKLLSPEFFLIITGDFNDSPESEVRTLLENEFPNLVDGWRKFHSLEETSHHAFQGEVQNGARIDWILTDERLPVRDCFLDKSARNGFYPTDHFPVVCRFSV